MQGRKRKLRLDVYVPGLPYLPRHRYRRAEHCLLIPAFYRAKPHSAFLLPTNSLLIYDPIQFKPHVPVPPPSSQGLCRSSALATHT